MGSVTVLFRLSVAISQGNELTRSTPGDTRPHSFQLAEPLSVGNIGLIRDGKVAGSGILYLTPTRYTVTTRMILH